MTEQPSPADFVASIAQSGNDLAKNWLRLAAAAPGHSGPADYLARLGADAGRVGAIQADYLEKQRRLWSELAAGGTPAAVRAALGEIRDTLQANGHGVELVELGEGWQILTRPEFTDAIERAQLAARPHRLSGAALETLAIIAYRQPIGRAEIEEIRGVNCGAILKSLQERALIDVTGRGEGMGRPLLYGTVLVLLLLTFLLNLTAIALRARLRARLAGRS